MAYLDTGESAQISLTAGHTLVFFTERDGRATVRALSGVPGAPYEIGRFESAGQTTIGPFSTSCVLSLTAAGKDLEYAFGASPVLTTTAGGLALATGVPAGTAIRKDKPFAGVVYENGVALDNNYTVATLPTAAAAYAGLVAWVSDATASGLSFECLSYDGGTTWVWVPVGRVWPWQRNRTVSTAQAGTNAFVETSNFTLPNRTDVYVPGMDIVFEANAVYTGTTSTKTQRLEHQASGNFLMSHQASAAQLSSETRCALHVGPAVGGQFQIANSASASGYTAGSGADLAFSFTLPGALFRWGFLIASGSDTGSYKRRDVTLIYP